MPYFSVFTFTNANLSLPKDLVVPFLFVLGFAAAHSLSLKLFINPLSFWLLPVTKSSQQQQDNSVKSNPSTNLRQRKQKQVPKFGEKIQLEDGNFLVRVKFVISMWRFICYSSSVAVGVYTFYNVDFMTEPELYFKGWPNHPMRFYFIFRSKFLIIKF